jgi:MFS transporter, DHA1 family, multidrug resistance protein
MLVGMACFTLFCIPVATGTNIQTILIGRFFCGMFSVAPLTIVGGALVDLWDPVDRGVATAGCAGAIFGSPILGPIIGNYIAASYLRWRWDNWLSGIMGIFCVVLIIFGLPETYGPTILRKRAAKFRKETDNKDAKCIYDGEANDIRAVFRVYLVRPFG